MYKLDLLAELLAEDDGEFPVSLYNANCGVGAWTGGRSYLMKGLTTVIRARMYQAGWTTKRPFRSFFSLGIMTALLV